MLKIEFILCENMTWLFLEHKRLPYFPTNDE